MNAQAEAKQLNIRLEQDDGEWIAILANHPDLKGDEEVGFPAPSEEAALAEARAYRSIEQSSVFKFEYSEATDEYIVSFADQQHKGKFLSATYGAAQKAYADMINAAEPPKPEPEAPPAPKQTRQRKPRQPGVPADAPEAPIVPRFPPNPNITSGIGTGQGQLPPAQNPMLSNEQSSSDPWQELEKRIVRLENILHASLSVTARALEELDKK